MRELLPLFLHLSGRRVLLVGAGPVGASKLHSCWPPVRTCAWSRLTCTPTWKRRRSYDRAPRVRADGSRRCVARRRGRDAGGEPPGGRGRRGAPDFRERRRRSAQRHGISGRSRSARRRDAARSRRAARRRRLPACCAKGSTRCCRGDLGAWMDTARRARHAWRRDGVPMEQRRPLLLRGVERPVRGTATAHTPHRNLVGVVPSGRARYERGVMANEDMFRWSARDRAIPALLTRKAAIALRRADLVLYDALVDERVVRPGDGVRSGSTSASAQGATRCRSTKSRRCWSARQNADDGSSG